MDDAKAAFITFSMSPKSCSGEAYLVFCMETVVHWVLDSEILLPATEKENRPTHFAFLLYMCFALKRMLYYKHLNAKCLTMIITSQPLLLCLYMTLTRASLSVKK